MTKLIEEIIYYIITNPIHIIAIILLSAGIGLIIIKIIFQIIKLLKKNS